MSSKKAQISSKISLLVEVTSFTYSMSFFILSPNEIIPRISFIMNLRKINKIKKICRFKGEYILNLFKKNHFCVSISII